MNALGIVLVHGYSGRSAQLLPLTRTLVQQFGQDAVCSIDLPGHADGMIPDFDAIRFGRCIDEAVQSLRGQNRRIILLGHSTGGTLVLDHIQRTGTTPTLLILAATPAVIESSDLARWEQHRNNRRPLTLLNLARLVLWSNRVTAATTHARFPVLILQGSADPLVPPFQARIWCQSRFSGPVRCLTVPRAGHDLFNQPNHAPVLDAVCRAISDVDVPPGNHERRTAAALQSLDSWAAGYVTANWPIRRHLLNSPAVSRALNRKVDFGPVAATDPIQLNIEITSRCNLACMHCARSRKKGPGRDMEMQAFEYILDLLPNTFKVNLVGLGEPTLHPKLPEFVLRATQRGRVVGLVTNATQLEKSLSSQLVAAGVRSVTFSLDSVDPELAARIRRGSQITRIVQNIRDFLSVAGSKVATAVFTAVSRQSIHHLPALAETVAGLGVRAWMLSDLNFEWNQPWSLQRNWTRTFQEDVRRAIKAAFSRGLPVISVRALEELALDKRYADFLITAPACLQQRSKMHAWCLSPWQTLPVDVDGNAMACDCRPDMILGNVLQAPLAALWNGRQMRSLRRQMRAQHPPAECLACPRF